MNKSIMVTLVATLLVVGTIMEAGGQVPTSIDENVPGAMNYQGRLVAPGGAPYTDATYTFDIRIYTEPNGGTPRWGGTYSSYVKDGYFNIMLGASGGTAITAAPLPVYTHTDLWKALWPDPVNGNPGDSLYLSVTPWQASNGVEIPEGSRTELSPRQTLLTAPYAFRAQTADSANRANGDFAVSGTVTADDLDIDGDLLRTSGSSVYVGGPNGNTSANYVNINAYDVDIDAGTADLRMSSTDDIYLTAADHIVMNNGHSFSIVSGGSYYVRGQTDATMQCSAGPVNLSPSTAVRGKNQLLWTRPGNTAYVSPFSLERITVAIPANSRSAQLLTTKSTSMYSCMIVGIYGAAHGLTTFRMVESSGNWGIHLEVASAATYVDNVHIDVLSITKNFVDDDR